FCFSFAANTEIYTLSLHDALPISESPSARRTVPAAIVHRYPDRNSPANAVGWQLARPTKKDAAACTGGKFASENPRPANESDSGDRKSTRLNSSHVKISYAVFCLK